MTSAAGLLGILLAVGVVRCGRLGLRTRSWREAEALGACPGCDPVLPAILPRSYAWLVAHPPARAASCLKGKWRRWRALIDARQCLYREGSGLAAGCSGQSLESINEIRVGPVPRLIMPAGGMTEPRGLSLFALQ